jgi:hypothetical protein
MNSMDLNIENYDLDDILKLFKINSDFGVNDLKRAKQTVLQIHPDKSKLHPDYFRFYLKAYKKLYDIFEFKNKNKLHNSSANDHIDYKDMENYLEEDKKKILDAHLSKKNIKDNFNKWFNEEFEKNNIKREEDSSGYGDWLKSNEGIEKSNNKFEFSDLENQIEIQKKRLSQMIVYKGVSELEYNNTGSYLTGDIPENFSSDLFSQLPYEDLRKAHTESVIPVTIDDYNNIPKFKDVNEFKTYRNSQSIVPLSEKESHNILTSRHNAEEYKSSINAYKLAKQMEESQKLQDGYWSSLSYILDKK